MFYCFILLFSIVLPFFAQAEIHQAFSVADLKPLVEKTTANTLLIFDMDYTLVMLENPAFHRPVFRKNPNTREWIRHLYTTLSPEEELIFPGYFMTSHPLVLVEPRMPSFLRDFQSKTSNFIVLTGSPTGNIGSIQCIEDHRHAELERLGISISSRFLDAGTIIFNHLPSERGHYPIFKHGILCTNGDTNSKGDVLKAFLQAVHFTPSQVIFIDDQLIYLKAVEATLSELGIPFIGIHYLAADHVPSSEIPDETIRSAWEEMFRQVKLIAEASN